MKRLYLMITITNRVASRRFVEFYQRFGASQILSALGRGTASDDTLINKLRLAVSVNKYRSQYAGKPLVMEFGFHTMEYNDGKKPNQTAGLVANKAAKQRAIKATIAYYRTVPEFRGALYFGYNLYKKEGNPAAVMDWTLQYPDDEQPAATTSSTSTGAAETTTTPVLPRSRNHPRYI